MTIGSRDRSRCITGARGVLSPGSLYEGPCDQENVENVEANRACRVLSSESVNVV